MYIIRLRLEAKGKGKRLLFSWLRCGVVGWLAGDLVVVMCCWWLKERKSNSFLYTVLFLDSWLYLCTYLRWIYFIYFSLLYISPLNLLVCYFVIIIILYSYAHQRNKCIPTRKILQGKIPSSSFTF